MNYLYLIIPGAFLLLAIIFIIIFHFKKKSIIRKVRELSVAEKTDILNELAKSIGYMYEPHQDLFIARHDAPQKLFGYKTLYDKSASYFNMVFDYMPIYFNYRSRTWLIQMWKGQYGINTGCELGIYHADKIIPEDEYSSTRFEAVTANEMLNISLKFNKHYKNNRYSKLGAVQMKHWWLTMFKMGLYTKPADLFVNTSITFRDYRMMRSFLDSFKVALPETSYKVSGLTVYFTFDKTGRKYSLWKRIVRRTSLFFCHLYCKLFKHITRPFSRSGDRLLYLYYYLPFIFRRIIK